MSFADELVGSAATRKTQQKPDASFEKTIVEFGCREDSQTCQVSIADAETIQIANAHD